MDIFFAFRKQLRQLSQKQQNCEVIFPSIPEPTFQKSFWENVSTSFPDIFLKLLFLEFKIRY